MNEIIDVRPSQGSSSIVTSGPAVPLPEARVAISVRVAAEQDVPAIDALMKRHSKQLAFLTRETLIGKVKLGHALVAEAATGEFAGYLIGNDRYKHRDELGVIYQVCVVPEYRRMLVGAHLLKARFESSAYGCRLYCCWCAQDLVESNRFYESMGFVPIAFRAGSEKRSRVHIFWQKRIRAGDTTTPWWFPSETAGGLMDAHRIVLPIPPGVRWSDEMPRITVGSGQCAVGSEASDEKTEKRVTKRVAKKAEAEEEKPVETVQMGRMQAFAAPSPVVEKKAKAKKQRVKTKFAPEVAAQVREVRDRWSEQQEQFVALPAGKYDVARAVDAGNKLEFAHPTKSLAA
jgi:N-acetylglutamate synthase-like GNAT family acetyltransferase